MERRCWMIVGGNENFRETAKPIAAARWSELRWPQPVVHQEKMIVPSRERSLSQSTVISPKRMLPVDDSQASSTSATGCVESWRES